MERGLGKPTCHTQWNGSFMVLFIEDQLVRRVSLRDIQLYLKIYIMCSNGISACDPSIKCEV